MAVRQTVSAKYSKTLEEILDYPANKNISIPSKALCKTALTPNSFHDAMKVPLTLMQFFGFFPLSGIREQSYRNLRFSWVSWKVLYSVVCLVGYILHFVLYYKHKHINDILEMNELIFHVQSIVAMLLCINLAANWFKFAKEWHLAEVSMKGYVHSKNLKKEVILICSSMLSIAAIEHVMSNITRIIQSTQAHPKTLHDGFYEYFVHQTFVEIFHYLPFYIILGLFFQFLVLQKTFVWTFMDIFIIVVSKCLSFRLEQISNRLTSLSKTEISDIHVWKVIREDYVRLSKLCDMINKRLCWFIIISYLANIYYILTQLYGSLKPLENTFQKIYFYVSFFLLIMRVSLVCLFGGTVHDQHAEIVRALSGVPSSVYNIEVTSAIVTYELVLIQYNAHDFKKKEI